MFSCWCTYVPLQKSKRILRNTVEKKFTLVSDKIKVQILVFLFFFYSWTSYFFMCNFSIFLVAFSLFFFMNFTTIIAADAAYYLVLWLWLWLWFVIWLVSYFYCLQPQIRLIRQWHNSSRLQRRMRRCAAVLQERTTLNTDRRTFITWRCQWMSQLFWRGKELKIETTRWGVIKRQPRNICWIIVYTARSR